MFGAVPMHMTNQEGNTSSKTITNTNEKLTNETNPEAMLMDTMQYQLPSTENIAQHRPYLFFDATSKIARTGTFNLFNLNTL